MKKLLAASVATAALVTGSALNSTAQQQLFPMLPPQIAPLVPQAQMPGLKNTAGYSCLPRMAASTDFNRVQIDTRVDMDFRMLPVAQNVLMMAQMKNIRLCPDKSLRRNGMALGDSLLSPGVLDTAALEARVARNEFLMAYELANFWLNEKGYSDKLLFQSQNENQQYHMMREAATWSITANMLFDLKHYQQKPEAWNVAVASPYGDVFRAYETAYAVNPSSEYNGIPHLRAFQQWFANPGRGRQVMQDVNWLMHGQDYVASQRPLTPEFLTGLGQRPEIGKANFFSEVQNDMSPFPDRDPTRFYNPGNGFGNRPQRGPFVP